MTKNLTVALAATAFLALVSALPANAAVLLALTTVVGGPNWSPADPMFGFPPGSQELFLDLSQYFQYEGGPGGPMTITYGGPSILYSHDQIGYLFHTQYAECVDPSGCVNGDGIEGSAVDGGYTEDCCMTYPIDSSYYIQDIDIPAFAPYGATFTGYQEGYVSYEVEEIVGPDAIGQPFSVTVSIVPEPSMWTLMLAGFFGIGFVLRGSRRRRPYETSKPCGGSPLRQSSAIRT